MSHAFLAAVEESGSANARTGWLPQHAVLRDGARSGEPPQCTPLPELPPGLSAFPGVSFS